MRLTIATPIHDSTCALFAPSLVETMRALDAAGVTSTFLPMIGVSRVGPARNALVNDMLRNSIADALLFVDSDQFWAPQTALALAFALREGIEIAGAPVASKNMNWNAIHTAALAGVPAAELPHHAVASWCHRFFDHDLSPEGYVGPVRDVAGAFEFVRASHLGTGFLAIHRSALEQLIEGGHVPKYRRQIRTSIGLSDGRRENFSFFRESLVDGEELGEDYASSEAWRAAGGELWLLKEATVGHVGRHDFGAPYDLDRDAMKRAKVLAEAAQ